MIWLWLSGFFFISIIPGLFWFWVRGKWWQRTLKETIARLQTNDIERIMEEVNRQMEPCWYPIDATNIALSCIPFLCWFLIWANFSNQWDDVWELISQSSKQKKRLSKRICRKVLSQIKSAGLNVIPETALSQVRMTGQDAERGLSVVEES